MICSSLNLLFLMFCCFFAAEPYLCHVHFSGVRSQAHA
jgi:hypothetical protein